MKKITSKLTLLAAGGLALIAAFSIQSCSKKSNGPSGPTPIGGYTSSDSVAASNLVAYWPFDADCNDKQGGLTANISGVSFVTGIRGQAYQGSANSYASLVPGAALQGLQSFSLSVWYYQVAQPSSNPNDPQGIFFMADAAGDPEIILENESYSPVSGDSVSLHNGFVDPAAVNYQYWILAAYDTNAIGNWVHFVMSYDGGTSTYVAYQDAVPLVVSSTFGDNTSTMLTDGPAGATPASPPLGNINYLATSASTPTQVIIGTWPVGTFGVSPTALGGNGSFVGKLDELRIFNVALTQQEVSGLYLNGLAGR